MKHNEKAARLGSGGGKSGTYQRGEHNIVVARGASPRRDNRRRWQPVRIGELIDAALRMADTMRAEIGGVH